MGRVVRTRSEDDAQVGPSVTQAVREIQPVHRAAELNINQGHVGEAHLRQPECIGARLGDAYHLMRRILQDPLA